MNESVIEVAVAIDGLNYRGMRQMARGLAARLNGLHPEEIAEGLSDWAERIVKADDPAALPDVPTAPIDPVPSNEFPLEPPAGEPDADLTIPPFLDRRAKAEAAE